MHKFYYGSLAVLILLLSLHVEIAHSTWWHWFAPAKPTQSTQSPQLLMHSDQLSAFDFESASAVLRNGRGSQLLEQAKKQTTEHTCWHHAYASLVSSCREILGDESAKTRLALKLVNCFLKVSGRPVLKPCPQQAPVTDCTAAMNDHVHSIFLAFFIDAASMCHHLQSEAFKLETELVINKLKDSAHWVEEKLQSLKQESETMIENSGQIIGLQEKLREEHAVVQGTINNMQASVDAGLSSFYRYATELNAQLKDVTHFQKDLADQQEKMAHQQHVLSKTIATDISALKQKANALGHSLEKSLVGQEELMVGQGLAITSLNNLHKQQVDALEESRSSLQELASEAKMHQAEFRIWQKELDRMQHDLAEGSASMLNAQEAFVSKQAAIFSSLDRLFSLHNAILLESRSLKTLFFYAVVALLIHVVTGTKQTGGARGPLYMILSFLCVLEVWLIHIQTNNQKEQHEFMRKVFWIRATFAMIAFGNILYSFLTFRDYATMSYKLLLEIQNMLQQKPANSFTENACFQNPTYSRTALSPWTLACKGFPKDIIIENEVNQANTWKCYQGPNVGEDNLVDDPDYQPPQHVHLGITSKHHYNLRSHVRRRDLSKPQSANILYWETVQMFTDWVMHAEK